MSFAEEYQAYCTEHGTPARLEAMLVDVNTVMRGKWLPQDAILKLEKGAVRLPLSTYVASILGFEAGNTGFGIVAGDPDGVLIPLQGTLKPAPWAGERVAQVLVEMLDQDGAICVASPRQQLLKMLKRYRDQGLRPVVATELEFYILKARKDRSDPPVPPELTPDAQNYDMELMARRAPILEEIQAACEAQRLPIDTLIAEFGPGQFEINFHHTEDVLAAAETAILFRHLVRRVVASYGLEATFMAKPYHDHAGNGMHAHMSILDQNGENIFIPAQGDDIAPTLKHAVAGLLATMRDLQLVFAPHANSYRRFRPMSFAPSTPDWGLDNRGAGVRIPDTKGPAARLEHRISGADVNPYLALAAILGGALHGLTAKPSLPLPLDHPKAKAADPLAHDWLSTIDRFAGSDFAAEIFGDFRDLYAAVKRGEVAPLQDPITPSEFKYYLSRL